ncbi:hypothetical protein BDP55DRAFT_637538 [Colletotrichum godetiae]|uniref:Uncharacterized protein n=1 Tax=Colletotrichum godetiae TaxID=1209918 RepID=A0AAJ0EPN3_9PEZI|nr:uncharacterized protein BDP55DRAFT_637538 [Colletotrichum godetiae]KAK1658727.1 hypothetical protein BDP55DRAFT_637538 [Colletotrichum godetiae]
MTDSAFAALVPPAWTETESGTLCYKETPQEIQTDDKLAVAEEVLEYDRITARRTCFGVVSVSVPLKAAVDNMLAAAAAVVEVVPSTAMRKFDTLLVFGRLCVNTRSQYWKLQKPSVSTALETMKQQFDGFIEGFLSRSHQTTSMQIRRNTNSWEDVMAEAGAISDKYKKQKNSFGCRNQLFTRSSRPVEFLIEVMLIEFVVQVMPEDDVTLKSSPDVTKAASRHHALVHEIDATKTYARLYEWSPRIRHAVEAGFGGFRAGVKSVFAGEEYGSELRKKDNHVYREDFGVTRRCGQKEALEALRSKTSQHHPQPQQQINYYVTLSMPRVTGSMLLSTPGFGLLANAENQALSSIQKESELVFFVGNSLSPQKQGRLTSIKRDQTFQNWSKSTNSQVLVLSGMDFDVLHTDVVSTLSYMCSLLARTISRMYHAFPLAFFCRIHCDPEGPLPGATGLLRSLIPQILLSSNGQIDMDFLTEASLHVVQYLDIQVL